MAIKVLNKSEYGITSVGYFRKKLYYCRGFWGRGQYDIVKVLILDSKLKKHKDRDPEVSADIDIYTSKNEVIEVWSNDRQFIGGCVIAAQPEHPREQFRRDRRNK